ncbi:hypothetical protein EFS16_06505 [Levilactobacillus brevis]|uniref:hypothetical protein n=1 Tax=Levilactobacillus brevis TaxID=1580 RepID=UPI0021A3DD7C|nr:hypothetical protein [Levilactobacillus brevis]MCT3578536.1 hypothetical protein [Levilactobacillus brevis]
MSKDEIVQELFNQIHAMNDDYIAIISIVLVLTGIAFSVLMWLQVRLSGVQYKKMKSELLSELIDKYDLKRISPLSIDADNHIKMVITRLAIKYTYTLSETESSFESEQDDFVAQLCNVADSFERAVFLKDRNTVGQSIWELSTAISEAKDLNEFNKLQLKEVIDKTEKYNR